MIVILVERGIIFVNFVFGGENFDFDEMIKIKRQVERQLKQSVQLRIFSQVEQHCYSVVGLTLRSPLFEIIGHRMNLKMTIYYNQDQERL